MPAETPRARLAALVRTLAFARVPALFVAVFLGAASVQAQSPADFGTAFSASTTTAERLFGGASGPIAPAADPPAPTPSPDQLRSAIEQVLKEREDKRKQEEERKKREADEAEHPVDLNTVLGMNTVWRNGITFETPNRDFAIHFGGIVQYDMAFYHADNQLQFGPGGTGKFYDGVTPRRMRLRTEGEWYEVLDFRVEFEFINGINTQGNNVPSGFTTGVFLTEGWMGARNLPVVGNFRAGNQKEPFSLEGAQSDRFVSFMERSLLFDAFNPNPFNNGFTPGLQVFDTLLNDRMFWAAGVFKNNRNPFGLGYGDGQYAFTGRLTGLPVYADAGTEVVHVGFAYSHRDLPHDLVSVGGNTVLGPQTWQFRLRPSIRSGPGGLQTLIANTGNFGADSQDLFNAETAIVLGPLTVRSQYEASIISNAVQPAGVSHGTYFTQGCYVEALYFLTGEHSNYDPKYAIFVRDAPRENFYTVTGYKGNWLFGSGAWQLASRYNYMDLTNAGIKGGTIHDVTLGVNWLLNANARVIWNYEVMRRSNTGTNSDGVMQAVGMRFAMDF